MNYKKNNIILKVIISILHVMAFLNIYSLFIDDEVVNDFMSLLLLLIELITLLNLIDIIMKNYLFIDFGLLCAILLLRLNLLNNYCLLGIEKYLGILLVLGSMIFHIYILIKLNNDKKQERTDKSVILQKDVEKYIFQKIMLLFKQDVEVRNDNIVKQYLWITGTAFIAIILFLGKFAIDIKNIFRSTYIFDIEFIYFYIVLNILFLGINFMKAKAVGCNCVIDLFEGALFLIGANLFVFAQKDYARFQILVTAAYLCSPYVMKTRDLIHKKEERKDYEE